MSKSSSNSDSRKALAEQRKRLRVKLWREREIGLPAPPCDYCDDPIRYPDDCVMHEAIVRRGVAMGWPLAERIKIYCEENCQLLHVGECHKRAHAEPKRMVAIQIKRYGRERIQAWIDTLPFKVPFHWDRGITEDELAKIKT